MKKIIDVSHHNGVIDFSKLKGKIDGVIIRCGYGDDITSQDDKQFKHNVENAILNSIPFGIYFFGYATNETQVQSEIAHCKRLALPYKDMMSYPLYYDDELDSKNESYALTATKTFCEEMEKAGFYVGVYTNEDYWIEYLASLGDRFTKWIAKWGDIRPTIPNVDAWQFTSKAQYDGINGNVDTSYFFKDFPINKTNGNVNENISANAFQIGDIVTLTDNVRVRKSPNGGKNLNYENLTPDGKKHATLKGVGQVAVLAKGTQCTIKEIAINGNRTDLRIPSGWVCASIGNETYVTK